MVFAIGKSVSKLPLVSMLNFFQEADNPCVFWVGATPPQLDPEADLSSSGSFL